MKKLALLLLTLSLAACAPSSPQTLGEAQDFKDSMTVKRFFVPPSPEAALPGEKPADPLRQKQLAEAQSSCQAQGIRPDAGSTYWHCVNAYLWLHYRWVAALNPDGSLHVIIHRAGYRPGYFF
jgi:hypothetical protein